MSTVNKSEIIRQVAGENPQLAGQPTAIAKLCFSQHNITVSAAAVNQALRTKSKAPSTSKATKPAKSTAPKAAKAAKTAAPKAAKTVVPKKPRVNRQAVAVKSTAPVSSGGAVEAIAAAKSLLAAAGGTEQAKSIIDALAG